MPCVYEIVRDHARFAAIEPAWRELWQRSDASVFQSHVWITACLEDVRLHIGLAWQNDRLLAVLPLTIRYRAGLRVLEWAGQQFSDYCDALAEPKHDVLVHYLWRHAYRAGGFDLIWLKQVAHGANFYPLTKTWRAGDCCLQIINYGSLTGESWFRSLNKKTRNNHLRGQRILGQSGQLVFREVSDGQIDPLLMWASDLKRDWLAKHHQTSPLLRTDGTNALTGLVHALASLGALRVFLLECADQPVAISVNVVQNQVMLAFFATYDPRFERGSPGIVLMTEYTKWAFDQGIKTVDYLRGEEPYKFTFANESVHMASLIAAKTLRGSLGLMVYRLKNSHQTLERPALGSAYRTANGMLRQPVLSSSTA